MRMSAANGLLAGLLAIAAAVILSLVLVTPAFAVCEIWVTDLDGNELSGEADVNVVNEGIVVHMRIETGNHISFTDSKGEWITYTESSAWSDSYYVDGEGWFGSESGTRVQHLADTFKGLSLEAGETYTFKTWLPQTGESASVSFTVGKGQGDESDSGPGDDGMDEDPGDDDSADKPDDADKPSGGSSGSSDSGGSDGGDSKNSKKPVKNGSGSNSSSKGETPRQGDSSPQTSQNDPDDAAGRADPAHVAEESAEQPSESKDSQQVEVFKLGGSVGGSGGGSADGSAATASQLTVTGVPWMWALLCALFVLAAPLSAARRIISPRLEQSRFVE